MIIVQEYYCDDHGMFSLREPCNEDESPRPCPDCNAPSEYRMSAPKVHMPVGTVVTGGSQERPPHALDTRPLAEGMPHREWHKAEREKDRKATYSRIKREM